MLTHEVLVFESLAALADSCGSTSRTSHALRPLTHGSGHNALVFTMKGCSQVIHSPSGSKSSSSWSRSQVRLNALSWCRR